MCNKMLVVVSTISASKGRGTRLQVLNLSYIQGVFFNWCPPKIHKYGKKLKYQNWCPPKNSKYQPVRKFWHLGLL